MNQDTLTPEDRERWEERAAIREYDGKMTRAEAELLAWDDLFRNGVTPCYQS